MSSEFNVIHDFNKVRNDIKTVCEERGFEFVDGTISLRNGKKYRDYLANWKGENKVLLHKYGVTESGKLVSSNQRAVMLHYKVNGNQRCVGLTAGEVSLALIGKILSDENSSTCGICDAQIQTCKSRNAKEWDHFCLQCGYAVCRECMKTMAIQAIMYNKTEVK